MLPTITGLLSISMWRQLSDTGMIEPSSRRTSFTLRYVARVVTPGTYAWEPAVAQSGTDEAIANLTPASSITIQ